MLLSFEKELLKSIINALCLRLFPPIHLNATQSGICYHFFNENGYQRPPYGVGSQPPVLFDLVYPSSLAYSAAHSLLPCLLEQHTFQVSFVFNRPSISFLGYSSSCWHCNASRPKESVFIFSFVPSLTVLVITSNFMLVTHKHVSPALISVQNSRLIKLTAFLPKGCTWTLMASNSKFQTWMPDFPLCFAYNLPQRS